MDYPDFQVLNQQSQKRQFKVEVDFDLGGKIRKVGFMNGIVNMERLKDMIKGVKTIKETLTQKQENKDQVVNQSQIVK